MSGNSFFFYNGATGGLGKYLEGALRATGAKNTTLKARLDSPESLRTEVLASALAKN